MLPSACNDSVGALIALFRSSIPIPPIPLFMLRRPPRDDQRKTRGRADRYSFLVRLSHSLHHAGLSRRSVTPLPRYYGPLQDPLVFHRFPGCSSYTACLAPPISRRDEEGFSSCFACPCHRAVASYPARVDRRVSQVRPSMLPSPYSWRLGLWGHSLSRPPLRSLWLRPDGLTVIPRRILSIGFKDSVSFLLAIQVTRLLTFAPVGLSSH